MLRKVLLALQSNAHHPLNRKRKWRAALQFLIVQVAVRSVPGDISVAFPNGTRLLISPRMKGAAHFITPGLCEFDEMSFVMHLLRPSDVFVDVGANVGPYTVLASGGIGCRTIAYEPSPTTFEHLLANIRLNDLTSKVIAHNRAAGSGPGQLSLSNGLGTENFVLKAGSNVGGVSVPVSSLDGDLSTERPTLIKIDVEGFEAEVIAGARHTLEQGSLRALVIERTGIGQRYGYDEKELHERLRALGFQPFAYCAMERRLISVGTDAEGNIIYLRDPVWAESRIREARPYNFRGHQV